MPTTPHKTASKLFRLNSFLVLIWMCHFPPLLSCSAEQPKPEIPNRILFVVQVPSYWKKMTAPNRRRCVSLLKRMGARQPSLLAPYDIYLVPGQSSLILRSDIKAGCSSLVLLTSTPISGKTLRLDVPTNRILFGTRIEMGARDVQSLLPPRVSQTVIHNKGCCDYSAIVRFGSALEANEVAEKLLRNSAISYAQVDIVHLNIQSEIFSSN